MMQAFSGKDWFRKQLAPYLVTIKKSVAGAAAGWALLDRDPDTPAPGAPWLLKKTAAPALSGFFGGVPVFGEAQEPAYALKVKTGNGRVLEFRPYADPDFQVPEFTDCDKPGASVGDHWIKKTSAKPGGTVSAMIGSMPITTQSAPVTFEAKWFTSDGVRAVQIS